MADDNKITVWFLSGWYPSRVHDTLGNFVRRHAEATSLYCNTGVIHVCTDPDLSEGRELEISQESGFPEIIVYMSKGGKIPLLSKAARYLAFRRAYLEAAHVMAQMTGKPDLIHSNVVFPVTQFARLLARLYNIPYVITEHWTAWLPDDPVQPGSLALHYSRRYCRDAAAILPVTDALGKAMQRLGLKGHYITVENVVNTEVFKPLTVKQHPPYRLLHISTLHPVQKNFEGLLRAVALLAARRNDFVLEVVSDGDFSIYRPLISELGLSEKVHFYGKRNSAEIAEITASCDILLLFSRYENFPCVIAEALSAGIPVLSTRVGGIDEHLSPSLGRLTEEGNPEEYCEVLDEMLHHLPEYDPSRLHAYAVDHFSYQAVGKKLKQLYSQILKR
jgi:glycosyltransferase involved in cell wall biosynthesis